MDARTVEIEVYSTVLARSMPKPHIRLALFLN